jgi:hypothetical protein
MNNNGNTNQYDGNSFPGMLPFEFFSEGLSLKDYIPILWRVDPASIRADSQ